MDVLPFSHFHFAPFLCPRAWIMGYFTCFAAILGVYGSLDLTWITPWPLLGSWGVGWGSPSQKPSWPEPLDEMKFLDELSHNWLEGNCQADTAPESLEKILEQGLSLRALPASTHKPPWGIHPGFLTKCSQNSPTSIPQKHPEQNSHRVHSSQ